MRVEHAADACTVPGCSFSVEGAGSNAARHVRQELREHLGAHTDLLPAWAIVHALANADPVYDHITWFFCGALTPCEAEYLKHTAMAENDDHAADCPYWMARQLLGLPPWPESLLVE